MSEAATRALTERMKTDQEFRDRLYSMKEPAERLEFIAAEGYDCTAAEIAAFGGAVTDGELADVAAGWVPEACQSGVCTWLHL